MLIRYIPVYTTDDDDGEWSSTDEEGEEKKDADNADAVPDPAPGKILC